MNNVPLEPDKVVERDGRRWKILDTDHHQIKQVSLQFGNTQQII